MFSLTIEGNYKFKEAIAFFMGFLKINDAHCNYKG